MWLQVVRANNQRGWMEGEGGSVAFLPDPQGRLLAERAL